MLRFYLSTVVIWMIILGCAIYACRNKIKEKAVAFGYDDKKSGFFENLRALFAMSAIPVFRVIVLFGIFYMSGCTQEEFNELMNKSKKDDNDGEVA